MERAEGKRVKELVLMEERVDVGIALNGLSIFPLEISGDGEYRYTRIPSSTAIFVDVDGEVDGEVVGVAGVDGIYENSYAELREKATFYWCDREQFLSEVVKTLSENSELVRNLNPDGSTNIDRLEVLAESAVSAVRG